MDTKITFQEKIFECDRHVDKITKARKQLSSHMPLSEQKYSSLTDIDESFIDQMIFRFSKLQDTMGEKIFPAILEMAGEEPKKKTFIDLLNRLEELEILKRLEWMSLREIRNNIAHEYSNNQNDVRNSITQIYTSCEKLLNIYESIKTFCRVKNWL